MDDKKQHVAAQPHGDHAPQGYHAFLRISPQPLMLPDLVRLTARLEEEAVGRRTTIWMKLAMPQVADLRGSMPEQTSLFAPLDWRRYWTASDEIPVLDHGYLLTGESHVFGGQRQTATLRGLETLSEVPCLVLLGPPGLGKSVELRKERERLESSGTSDCVWHVDLKGHSEASFRDAVFESSAFQGWARGEQGLILLLDSLDECWAQIRALIPTLTEKLRQGGLGREGHPPLRVRLGCRAAEWRAPEIDRLREVFGDRDGKACKVQVHQLCPLTREDVRLAALSRGVATPNIFLATLDEMGLGVLAAHPLTLDLLLSDAKEGRPIGPTRADVYRRGLLRLAEDAHEEPAASPRNFHTLLPGRRYDIAARIAAIGVLARRYHCRMPNGKRESSSLVLEVSDVGLGGSGAARNRGTGAEVEGIDPRALGETYRCGIFRATVGDCVTWQHQAYAEFLAAMHLAGSGGVINVTNSSRDLLGLVADLSGPAPRIYPPLEELALWLVELRPELFDHLLIGNGEVLLRCDPHTLTPERRQKIVESYFDQIRAHEAEGDDWEKRLPLERLAYPGLAEYLRRILRDRKESLVLRRTAIAIIAACQLRELAGDLVELAFEAAENSRVADHAASILLKWSREREESGTEIRTLVRARFLAQGDACRDDLRGVALSMLWPNDLTVDELAPYLTHSSRLHRLGAYEVFLYQDLAQRATDAQVVLLLRWAVRQKFGSDAHRDQRIKAVQTMAKRALASDQAELLDALVELALQWADYRSPHILALSGGERLDPVARQRFVARLVPRLPHKDPDFSHFADTACPIIDPADLAWAVEQSLAALDAGVRKQWERFVACLFRRDAQEDVETVWPLVENSADFAQWVATWTTCPIGIPEKENWRKRNWRREMAAAAKKAAEPPLAATLSEGLKRYEAGQLGAFFGVMEELFCDESGRTFPADEWAKTRGDSLSAEVHVRLTKAAEGYWDRVEVVDGELKETKVTYHKYRTALLALSYLVQREPDWLSLRSATWWEKWFPVFLRHQHWFIGGGHEFWPKAFRIVHATAPMVFARAMAGWLETMPGEHLSASLFEDEVACDPSIQAVLRVWVQSGARKSNGSFEVAGLLLKHGDREMEIWLTRIMIQRDEQTCDRHAAFAAAVLLNFRSGNYGERIATEFTHDEDWARAVLWRMNTSLDLPSEWAFGLPPELVATLWETLMRMVPRDPWGEGGGTVTFDHELSRLGGHLLNHLNRQHSPEAVAVVEALLARHPEKRDWLGQMLARVRRAQRREGWQPLAPTVAAEFLNGLRPRPLGTEGDLCDAVLASLGRYQEWLRGPNRPTELWNEPTVTRPYYEPKKENVLSDCLLGHLARDLAPRGVIVTREEETKSGTATEKGDYPDLVVRLPDPTRPGVTLRLYLEVKCAWNVEAITGLGEQLLGRYLRTADCGIYLLAHFACQTWNAPKDTRQRKALSATPQVEVNAMLRAELERLRATTGKRIEAFFLNAALQ